MIDERVSAPSKRGGRVLSTFTIESVFVRSLGTDSAEATIKDETVMDGDRECVNGVGDVLLSRLFIKTRRSTM